MTDVREVQSTLANGPGGIVLLSCPVALYALAGRGYAVFARHMLPVVPFLCITAAWAAVGVARRLAAATVVVSGPIVVSGFSRTALWTITICVLLVAAEPAWRSVMLDLVPPGATFS